MGSPTLYIPITVESFTALHFAVGVTSMASTLFIGLLRLRDSEDM